MFEFVCCLLPKGSRVDIKDRTKAEGFDRVLIAFCGRDHILPSAGARTVCSAPCSICW